VSPAHPALVNRVSNADRVLLQCIFEENVSLPVRTFVGYIEIFNTNKVKLRRRYDIDDPLSILTQYIENGIAPRASINRPVNSSRGNVLGA